MQYQFIVTGIVVLIQIMGFLLGLALWYSSREKRSTTDVEVEKTMNRSGLTASSDIIIVGAGVAGSALAYALGKDGRKVHVIERDLKQPDRMVGELLQPGGYLKLIELGMEDCVNEIDAQQVFGYVLYKDGKNIKLSYPFNSNPAGRSFHNGRFVQRMREKAASLSNVRLEQGTVTMLIEEKGTIKGAHYVSKTKAGQQLNAYAPLTIVCDGSFSNLRRTLCKPKVEVLSCFVGMVLKNYELPYPNHGHVILAHPSPILFYPISSTEIRCLVDIPGQNVPSNSNGKLSRYLKTITAPQIPVELHDAFVSAIEKGNFRMMGNRSMAASPKQTPGAMLIGDALNMRHPLTGGGMTVALSDVVLLRDLLRPLRDLNIANLQSFYILRKPMASTMNILADASYKLFSASPDHPSRKELHQVCFDYLKLVGNFSNGPIALLSGLNPRPWSLFFHFTAGAVYTVGLLLLPLPSPKRMARLIREVSSLLQSSNAGLRNIRNK